MKGMQWICNLKALPSSKYRAEIKRYLVLLLIPVLLLALLYMNVNHVVSQQAEDYAKLMTDHFYVQTSSMLHEMQLVCNTILRDSDVAKILETDAASSLDSLHICTIIQDGLKESPYVQHAYLFCKKSGNIYSDGGLFDGDSLSVLLDKIGTDESQLSGSAEAADYHVLNKSGMAPYCIFQIRDERGNSLGALAVSLRMTEFLRIFYSLDAELCVIFNDDFYISSYIKGINMDGIDWSSEESVSALIGKRVACEYLEESGYTYLVAVSRENYNRPLQAIIMWFFIYAAAALTLGYLYLYQVSKKRYQKISSLITALPESYAGDQSYEHIYDNIRRSLEEYRAQRENLQLENQEHALQILLESGHDHHVTPGQFQKAGVDPNYPYYYAATFFPAESVDPSLEFDTVQEGVGFLHLLLRTTIHELANQCQVSCAYCGIPSAGIAIVSGNDAAVLKEAVLKISRNVVQILAQSHTMSVLSTISSPVSSVCSLPDAYQETLRLRSFARSINSSATTIAQEELQLCSGVLLNGDFLRQEQILLNTILVRKYDAVPSMVEALLSTHVSPLRKNYALAQHRLESIANVLAEGVRAACVCVDFADDGAKAIDQADSVRQLVEVTNQVYGALADQCRDSVNESDIITLACSYIDQNLSDPNLNVSAICEAAGVSVQRLTRMFQSQFSMAVAEYMNACRIKRSKELLPDKQLTIVQIASQVGYSNPDTFTRNFKKIEGITATEYRKTLVECNR